MTKPRPVGRPRRAKKAAETRITIRLTEQEARRFESSAIREGISLGEWFRAAAELAYARGRTEVP